MSRIIALIGPTAVGKTDVSIELATRLKAEIIGCDSMQVYRGMSTLTQQPNARQRAAVRHHLIDCVEPEETFSAGQYRQLANETMARIQGRGKACIIVGGTGLYLKALMDGLCDAPPADAQIRRRLQQAIEDEGGAAVYQRLQQIDPTAAQIIHPHDTRRVVRALEVYEASGRSLSSFWGWTIAPAATTQRTGRSQTRATNGARRASIRATMETPAHGIVVCGLTRGRSALYERINRRVERMWDEESALEEAQAVLERRLSRTARQVHGLAFLKAYLHGEMSREEAVSVWQQQVRRYAKRQFTWFRADPRIQWLTLEEHETVARTVDRILACVGQPAHRVQIGQTRELDTPARVMTRRAGGR